jgi:hypothetical protein
MILLFFFVFVLPAPGAAGEPTNDDMIVLLTDFTYSLGKGDSTETARALALFGAKIKAVELSAKYFTHKDLLQHYGKKQHEIFCLTTDEVKTAIIEENFDKQSNSYYVKIKTEVRSSDFIKAEIRDSELEKKESKLSYRDEMEQHVGQTTDPGGELARAYRHIREKEWRIAIIYLDHLEKKYPHWGDIFLAKAIAFYSIDDGDKMTKALEAACSLNNQEACEDLKMILRTGDADLEPNEE